MEDFFLTLKQVSVKAGGILILDNIDFSIHRGEQWVIAGQAGSGKTVFGHTLLGKHFHSGTIDFYFGKVIKPNRIGMVEQQHRFKSLSHTNDLYYQQRFNASDADQTITVETEFNEYVPIKNIREGAFLDILHIRDLLSKPLIQLSNGENKRVQLAIALASAPDLLILDNPFLGLDTEGRDKVHQILNVLIGQGIHILLICSLQEIPEAITHIAYLEKGKMVYTGVKKNFLLPQPIPAQTGLQMEILAMVRPSKLQAFSKAVKMVDVSVYYGETVILDHIDWEVRKGERWSVTGPNGAGKSTLLSLITADNPQAYANELYLFDKKRGTGESIWDIKKMIGFVSPELHMYFDYSATCFEVIASGFFDTIGLFRQLTEREEETTILWMKLLQISPLAARRLEQVSTGQQRMVLLARALIKSPPLLILDEPCQGLDDDQISHFKNLITVLCTEFEATLIYVSHYKDHIPGCVDHFLKLEKGKVVA
jgi:molybdate transport system ATP-binding protein